MDKLVSILLAMLIGAGLMFAADRAPPLKWDVPIPFVPDFKYESLGAKAKRLQAIFDNQRNSVKPIEAAGKALAVELRGKIEAEQVRIRYVTQTLLEKVPLYVTPEADNHCRVPVGFVGLHDAAARGEARLPAAAGGPLDADSGVALSTVGSTVVSNYGACHDAIAEVGGWREWYPRAKAIYDAQP